MNRLVRWISSFAAPSRLELKKLQKKLGITFIYITHDQEEAINMSDPHCCYESGVLLSESEHRMKFITTRKQVMWPRL